MKLVKVLIIVLSLFFITSCETVDPLAEYIAQQEVLAQEELAAEALAVQAVIDQRYIVRQNVLEALSLFGKVEDEDLEPYESDGEYMIGAASMVVILPNEDLTYLFYTGHETIYMSLSIEAVALNMFSIDMANITYQDLEQNLYIDLYYYHYDKLLIADYAPEDVPHNLNEFANSLLVLTIEDWHWIIAELGY